MNLALGDPTYDETSAPRFLAGVARQFVRDVRDAPFLSLIVVLSLTVVPTGVALFLPGGFRWWLAAVHLVLVVYFLGPFILMLHNTSHNRLFKARWGWMNAIIPWVIGPFFGESPGTYFAHHIGMHHPENNLEDDLSSTLPYVRDSVGAFLGYFLRFFFGAVVELPRYFARKRRRALFVQALGGELGFFVMVGACALWEWRAALTVFVIPFVVARFGMMAGNWAQHAFVDRAAPESNYRNSITCINTGYNRRCFNDGYHIGHHLRQTRHWTDMPDELRENLATYAKEDAVVFRGIDFFGVWACLMLKRYDWLARRFVHLGGRERTQDEIVALLRERTAWTRLRA